jgi:hypothetical protein
VLVCPGCQAAFDWASELDRCPVCGGIHLVRRLGEVECKDCGSVREPAAAPGLGAAGLAAEAQARMAPGLAEEVEQALARVLGKAQRPASIS